MHQRNQEMAELADGFVVLPGGLGTLEWRESRRADLRLACYLLVNNRAIRDVIETVGKRAILILGRFSQERRTRGCPVRGDLAAGAWP